MKLIRPDADSEALDVPDPSVLGRKPARGLAVPHPTISREHARLFRREGTWHVADLDSSNGTFVNDARVSRSALAEGDRLRFGEVEFVVRLAEPIAEPGPPAAPEAGSGEPPLAPSTPRAAPSTTGPKAGDLPGDDFFGLDEIELEEGPQERVAEDPNARTIADLKPPPKPRPKPRPATRPSLGGDTKALSRGGRGDAALLRQDVAQQSGMRQLLVVLACVAVAAGLFFAVMKLTESVAPEGDVPGAVPTEGAEDDFGYDEDWADPGADPADGG